MIVTQLLGEDFVKRSIASSAAAVALVGSGLMAQPAMAAGSTTDRDGVFGPDVAIAGVSRSGQTYVMGSSDRRLKRISYGKVDVQPVIVVKGGTTHLLSVRNGRLVHRTEYRGWREVAKGSAPQFTQLNARLSSDGSMVHAVGLASDKRAYHFSFKADDATPNVTRFQNLGGSVKAPVVFVSAGPAAPGLHAGVTVFAQGRDYTVGAGKQNIYARNLDTSWVPVAQTSNLPATAPCRGDHSVGNDNDLIVAACGIGGGFIAVTWRKGTSVSPSARGAYILKGRYRGVPAVTVNGDDVRMAITRPNYGLATTKLPLKNAALVSGDWRNVSGKFKYGVSATVEK